MEAALRSAREVSQTTVNPIDGAIQVDAPRFFVQFGWNVLRVDTRAIPNMYLLRGEITPCKSYPQISPLVEIREGELIPGSEQGDPSGRDTRATYGQYWRRAYYEAERLIDIEQSSAHKQGIYEIKALAGINSIVYDNADLNEIFYSPFTLADLARREPEKDKDDKPKPSLITNKEIIAHLTQRVKEIEANGVKGIPAHYQGVVAAIGKELIAAAEYNDRIQQQRIEFTHTCMKLPPSDPSGLWKREYDLVDEEMLARTSTPRVHAADITTAKALDKLTDRPNTDEGFKILAEALMQQAAQQKQVIDMLLAEREEKATPARKRSAKDE